MDILKEIEGLKINHYYCEDSWYSCPLAQGGCCNDSKLYECDCEALAQHRKVDEILEELRFALKWSD